MKQFITTILALALGLSTAQAQLFNDGGTHDVTTGVDLLILKPDVEGNPTTVNMLPGGYIDGYVQMYSPCVLNIDVGDNQIINPYERFTVWGGQINLYSGIVPSVIRFIDGALNLYGGALSELECTAYSAHVHDGVINLYGGNFAMDGQAVDYGSIVLGGPDDADMSYYTLTGTLSSGDILDLDIAFDNRAGTYLLTVNFLPPVALSPEEMLDELRQFIRESIASGAIHRGWARSLLVKIRVAERVLERGRRNADKVAIHLLRALIHQVNARAGRRIDHATAEVITDLAATIIAELKNQDD